MNPRELLLRRGYWIGPIAAVYAWVVILSSAAVNPWWRVYAKALSYLGAGTSTDPWLYDYVGMVTTGLLLLLFSVYLWLLSRNRWERLGSSMFLLAGGLLVGIGIFHQGPGWYPVGSQHTGQNLHDLFSAWFFVQLLLTVLFWGAGLRKEGYRPLGLGMYTLAAGSLGTAAALLAAFGTIPGGSGEVIGVLAIDVWVGLMFFAKDVPPFSFSQAPPQGLLEEDETVTLSTRRSLLHAFQVPALGMVLVGMFLFFFGDYYLIDRLTGLIFHFSVAALEGIAVVVLGCLFGGLALVLLGSWRWSRVLPHWIGAFLFGLVLIVPLIFVATWFDTAGNSNMLLFFLVFALLLPLVISIGSWSRTRYVLTNRRVLMVPDRDTGGTVSIPRPGIGVLGVHRGLFHRFFGLGDIRFAETGSERADRKGRLFAQVEWTGIPHHETVVQALNPHLPVSPWGKVRRQRRPGLFVVCFFAAILLLAALCLVPVLSVQQTLEVPCAVFTSNLAAVEADPWPYIENVTLPLGHVSYTWWSGTPVWLFVGQLPAGPFDESSTLNSTSVAAFEASLTTSGTGGYTSDGGDTFTGCIGTESQSSVSLVFSYSAPVLWA